ncbi:gamma-aminobutyric acid receptor subunit beta-like isoform X2 [Metopolophium dirhodum]|uniref:gamma-aminobutyric acid receptor subunit beta-like isoform X2 n=1 Tax=Metopolophium dirhodum TaxID=44670 RepID=UPI00298F8F2F|nr:gamma-aminobutyric acid receptor subunit beta-like isoform X2 [Metopolophium dirhodum]
MTCGGRRLSPSYYRHHRRRCRHTGDPQHSRRGLNHQHDHRNHHHYHHNYYRHHHHRHHHHHHHHHRQHNRHGRGQSRLRAAVATDSRARLPYPTADAVAPSDATPLPLPAMRHAPAAARRHSSSSSSSSAAAVRRMSAWLVACVAFWAPSTPCTHAASMYGDVNISAILDSFSGSYDKRVRPNYGGPPVEVGVTMYVLSISSVSEVLMDFTLDFYFRQFWTDPRLAFTKRPGVETLSVGSEFIKNIWVPDTFFVNEKQSYFHIATTSNEFIRIHHSGSITRSIRLTITASCPMNLQYFPMDRQLCHIEIESFGYTMRDIRYKWNKGPNSVGVSNEVSLPQFKVLGHRQRAMEISLTTGNYSRLACEIQFVRSMGYYLIQIYIPSGLIVIISWVSFWLNRCATPARVSLGVTTVLTMTTLMSSTNAALPKISYVKSIDVYLGTCFVMVFASLLEYATVGYMAKRIQMRKNRFLAIQKIAEQKKGGGGGGGAGGHSAHDGHSHAHPHHTSRHGHGHGSISGHSTLSGHGTLSGGHGPQSGHGTLPHGMSSHGLASHGTMSSHGYDGGGGGHRHSHMGHGGTLSGSLMAGDLDHTPRQTEVRFKAHDPKNYLKGGSLENTINGRGDDDNITPIPTQHVMHPNKDINKLYGITPSDIDKYSRIVFPVCFICFNLMYWIIYLHISDVVADDLVLLGAD